MPTISESWSRKVWWIPENFSKEASSMTALTLSSKRTGRAMMLSGVASPRPELILT